jgi:uncharacterized membrane protein YraQ (UPF0718 family)
MRGATAGGQISVLSRDAGSAPETAAPPPTIAAGGLGSREAPAGGWRDPALTWGPPAVLLLLVVFRDLLQPALDGAAVATWFAVFVSICIQALPFLGLGIVLSAVIAAFVPTSWLTRALPRRTSLAVPAAGAAGLILPGCECGSVPVAGGLIARGVAPAAALAFLLSAPAINPVVLVSTAVAFPGRPEFVWARLLASFGVAVIMGLVWARFASSSWLRLRPRPHLDDVSSRSRLFILTAQHDFVHAGGFLVLGGMTAATMNVLVPRAVLDTLAGQAVVAVLTLAVLAVVLAICSEADAFIAASLAAFGPRAQLVFMVVGPAVDVKLIALQAGTFGRRFAARFAPCTFVVAVLVAVLVAEVLL